MTEKLAAFQEQLHSVK